MFKPEFLNRIDDIIVFRALSKEDDQGDCCAHAEGTEEPSGKTDGYYTYLRRHSEELHFRKRLRQEIWSKTN